MGYTSICRFDIDTVGTLASPAPLTVSFPAAAPIRFNAYDLLAGQILQSNDAPIVRSFRLLSNFADGLLFPNLYTMGGVGSVRPSFNLFGSGLGSNPTLNSSLVCSAATLNEWYPVNTPLPMVDRVQGQPAYLYAKFLSDLPDPTTTDVTFDTIGINTNFNGMRPAFVLQVQLETAY